MADALTAAAMRRWREDPASFIEEVLVDPETGKPFELLPAQLTFFRHAFKTGADGRLLYPELVYSCPKKSGKTATAAMVMLVMVLVFGGPFAEGYAVANDFEQAQGRVFAAAKRIVQASPLLKREADITANKITFPALGSTITALASDYAGAAGSNPTISVFDELWGFISESSRRLWDECVTSPARKISCRLTVTYAGFEGESELLEDLYKRGLAQPQLAPDLRGGDGMLMFWSHEPIAPWQTPEWVEDMRRTMRPNAFLRQVENRFVSTESTFIDAAWFDACVDPAARMQVINPELDVFVGVDASVKHDSTAVVAVMWDREANKARLVWHRIWQPSPDQPLDFEATIEQALLDLHQRFRIRKIKFDPYQLQASAQRLRARGLPMEEFPQSVPNLTEASQNLFELVKSGNIVLYPDADIRLAFQRAVAKETTRGWRIAKEKQSHKIDVVVALGMAALTAARKGVHAPYVAYEGRLSWSGETVLVPIGTPQPNPWPRVPNPNAWKEHQQRHEAKQRAWQQSALIRG